MSPRSSSPKGRKGVELTLQTVVVAILVLLVLVVLAIVFQRLVGKTVADLFGISNDTTAEARGEKCASVWLGRSCVASSADCTKDGYGRPLPTPAKPWPDCSSGVCCERAAERAEGPGVLG